MSQQPDENGGDTQYDPSNCARFAPSIPVDLYQDYEDYVREAHPRGDISLIAARDVASAYEPSRMDALVRRVWECTSEAFDPGRANPVTGVTQSVNGHSKKVADGYADEYKSMEKSVWRGLDKESVVMQLPQRIIDQVKGDAEHRYDSEYYANRVVAVILAEAMMRHKYLEDALDLLEPRATATQYTWTSEEPIDPSTVDFKSVPEGAASRGPVLLGVLRYKREQGEKAWAKRDIVDLADKYWPDKSRETARNYANAVFDHMVSTTEFTEALDDRGWEWDYGTAARKYLLTTHYALDENDLAVFCKDVVDWLAGTDEVRKSAKPIAIKKLGSNIPVKSLTATVNEGGESLSDVVNDTKERL